MITNGAANGWPGADSAVYFATISNAHNQDANQFIFDAGYDPVIANPVLPKIAEFCTLQRFANTPRILKWSDALE